MATPLPATGYQPGIALSRSISLGPMETFLLTPFCRWNRVSSGLVGEKETCIAATPKADSRYPGATLPRISRTCTKQISKFMTANTEEERHRSLALHSAPTISRSLRFQSSNDDNATRIFCYDFNKKIFHSYSCRFSLKFYKLCKFYIYVCVCVREKLHKMTHVSGSYLQVSKKLG